jgi:two-component system KDP operon response regulator KdpE
VESAGHLRNPKQHREVLQLTIDGEMPGAEIRLPALDYKLLAVLVQQAGKVVTPRKLWHEVRGPGHGDQTQYLRVYMAHLRRKLEPDPSRPRIFQTETGVGYRLLVEEASD